MRTKRNKLKTQYLVKIKEKDAETQLLKFLKENIKPDEQYGIYFCDRVARLYAYTYTTLRGYCWSTRSAAPGRSASAIVELQQWPRIHTLTGITLGEGSHTEDVVSASKKDRQEQRGQRHATT